MPSCSMLLLEAPDMSEEADLTVEFGECLQNCFSIKISHKVLHSCEILGPVERVSKTSAHNKSFPFLLGPWRVWVSAKVAIASAKM